MTTRTPSPRDEQPDRGPGKPHLSVRQQALWEELAALDQVLAGLYLHGVRLLSEADSPGVGHLIAHVGRELTLGVVEALLEEGLSLTQRGRSEIPEDEAHRGKIARSLGLDPSHARVSQWFDLHNSFVRATHHRRGNPAPDPDDIRLNFQRLEKFLYGRVAPYFETQSELDELLAVSEPDDDDLDRLETLLLRPKQRSYFFERLTHSGWIKPLDRRRIFRNPPERLVHPDGSWQAVSWPEGGFLARVAADEPELVVQILDRLDTSIENPAVWRVVADVASRVPPDPGFRLAPKLAEAAENVLPVMFTDELLTLIRGLADAGHGEAFDLAAVLLFVPNADDLGSVSPYGTRSDWLLPRLWRTQFPEFVEEALPSLERANPERALDLLLDRLRQIAAVGRKLDLPRLLDPRSRSSYRPDPRDVAEGMIEATAAVLTRFGEETPEQAHRALEMLDQLDDAVFTRLRYRLIASAGHHLQEELDALISSNVAIEPGDFGREIAFLLREQYENASDGAREVFRYAIQRGPDPETVWNRLRWREIASPSAAAVEGIKRDWQQQRLTWFRGEIPNELRDLAERLDVWDKEPSIRDQELAEVGVYAAPAVWSGEPTPFTADELGKRSAEEIARLIMEWRPDEGAYETGTIRGFQLSLQELATSNPAKALDIWQETRGELSFGFSASVLDGLRGALRAETEGFAWDRTLAVVLEAIADVESSPEIKTPVRQRLLRSATDLLEEGVNEDLIPPELEDRVWNALALIVESPVAWDEEERAFESFGDLLTASLNRVGSRAIQVTLQAGLWNYRRRKSDDADETSRIVEERVAPILDVILQRMGSSRITAEAMIGQYLPQLQLVAPKWLGEHLNELLEKGAEEPFERPTWGAYVTRSRLYDSTFEMLRPWYLVAAQAAGTVAGRKTSEEHDWSLTKNLAVHLMIAVLRGLASTRQSDRLVETVFESVSAEDRGHAYWVVFRDCSDAETAPPEPFVARLLTFWEWRLDLLEGFADTGEAAVEAEGLGWFLRTPYLPDEELLRFGLRTARAANGRLELQTEWDRLVELTATDADVALQIAELVLKAQLAETLHYIAVDEVKPFLQVVLDRGDAKIKSRARRLVHRLGEAGYDDFRELVE